MNPEKNEPDIRFETDSVYGGSMKPMEFWQQEMNVSDDLPEWVLPDVKGIKAQIMGEDIILCRNNTIIFDFDQLIDEENGITYDFEWMSHIYIHRGDGKKPYWHLRPENEEKQEEWNDLAKRLIMIDCDYRTGIPKQLDFEQFYEHIRGDEPIEQILGRIASGEAQ